MNDKKNNGQLDLQENFEYRGIIFSVESHGKAGTAHSHHIVNGLINGVNRTFSSTTRKQAKDMFKKAVRKNLQ